MYSSMNNFEGNLSKAQEAQTSEVDEAKMKDDIKELDRKIDESYSGTIGNITKNLDTNNIPNMTKQEIIDAIPDNWKYTEHNGFVHIKDETGKIVLELTHQIK